MRLQIHPGRARTPRERMDDLALQSHQLRIHARLRETRQIYGQGTPHSTPQQHVRKHRQRT
eukprot:3297954-Rhodomonas_salina.1